MTTGTTMPINHYDACICLAQQSVDKCHAGGAGADDEVIGLDRVCGH
jgi:hypothetical protein